MALDYVEAYPSDLCLLALGALGQLPFNSASCYLVIVKSKLKLLCLIAIVLLFCYLFLRDLVH